MGPEGGASLARPAVRLFSLFQTIKKSRKKKITSSRSNQSRKPQGGCRCSEPGPQARPGRSVPAAQPGPCPAPGGSALAGARAAAGGCPPPGRAAYCPTARAAERAGPERGGTRK